MIRISAFFVAIALLVPLRSAYAQSGRIGTLPSPPAPAAREVPVIVLNDGSVVADFGRGYERVIRSCAAYAGRRWPAGESRGRGATSPTAGGLQPAPGASGLQPAPGLSPVPGAQRSSVGTSTVGTSRSATRAGVAGTSTASVGRSGSTLQRPHSAWRTAGPVYYDGACYTQDAYGRLRLIRL